MMNFHKANTSTPYRMAHDAPISFESMIRETEKSSDGSECETIDEVCSDINSIPEGDIKKLQPVLWLELATIFDKHHIALDKRKPFKKKRKEEGNVFGVSLNALVRRDQQVTGEDTSLVPLILQSILRELVSRGAKEEGILRVAGHKQKVKLWKALKDCRILKLFCVADGNSLSWNRTAILRKTWKNWTVAETSWSSWSERSFEAMASWAPTTVTSQRSGAHVLSDKWWVLWKLSTIKFLSIDFPISSSHTWSSTRDFNVVPSFATRKP